MLVGLFYLSIIDDETRSSHPIPSSYVVAATYPRSQFNRTNAMSAKVSTRPCDDLVFIIAIIGKYFRIRAISSRMKRTLFANIGQMLSIDDLKCEVLRTSWRLLGPGAYLLLVAQPGGQD